MIKPSPPFWERYRQLQDTVAASSTENTRSRGDDNTLTAMLDELDQRELDDLQVVRLRENRSATFRHRLRAELLVAQAQTEVSGPAAEGRFAARQILRALSDQLSDLDGSLLNDLASGYSYTEAAQRQKISLEALKSRVSRLRHRLRAANEDLELLLVA